MEESAALFVFRDVCMVDMDVFITFDSDIKTSILSLLLSSFESMIETELSMADTTVLITAR